MSNYDRVREEIAASSKESSVYVGCDSIRFKKKEGWFARYSVVVVLHLDSSKGCKLFHKTIDVRDYGNLKQRLLMEAGFAIEVASEIIDVVGDRQFQVHLDLNPSPKHKSNVALKEAIGYVQGSLGITPIVKPHSWAASHSADHAVRGKLYSHGNTMRH